MRLVLPVLLAATAVTSIMATAECLACTVAQPRAYAPTVASADDQVWPSSPSVWVHVERGVGPQGNCMSESVSSCDDIGMVALRLEADDAGTLPEQMGFVLQLQAGELPEGLVLPEDPVLTEDGFVTLAWADGATDDQEPISFVLAVSAIDAAGNVSGATVVRVHDDGTGAGCRVVPARGGGESTATLLGGGLLALWVLRRRRSRPA